MKKIIHVDMDQFFAAVELLDHPELKGLPIGLGVSNQKGATDQPQPRWIQLELEFKD